VSWRLDASDGQLSVLTGVTGSAAKMGHRLTIVMNSWQADVLWIRGEPSGVDLTVEVDSLQILRGDGGYTLLSGPEKLLVRSNALKSLDAQRFPQIHFASEDIGKTTGGYRLAGPLTVRGKTVEHAVDLQIDDRGDRWRMSCQTHVRQSGFGVKPYSMFMGAMKVVDTVTVSFTAQRAKDH
jgi:polyisoprenoid-binding protein YceI